MDNIEKFSVNEVLKGSLKFIRDNPVVLLHQSAIAILLYIPSYIDYESVFSNDPDSFWMSIILIGIYGFLLLFFTITIDAMYPVMIKNMRDRKELDSWAAFNVSKKKFMPVLGALILIGIQVTFGFILLIIPGLIFLAWYYYTIPAIMINDLGVKEGMQASKNFAKDKKFKTFLLYLIPYLLVLTIDLALENVDMATEMQLLFDWSTALFLAVWLAVIPAYAYVKYADKNTPGPAITSKYGQADKSNRSIKSPFVRI